MSELTQKYLKECLDYNPETGIFIWLERPREHFRTEHGFNTFNSQCPGKVAGTKDSRGYFSIRVSDKISYAHRLAFLWMTGSFPSEEVDHKNHNRSDNRWVNLRLATKKENLMNAGMRKGNKSGFTGVYWAKGNNKWVAGIYANGSVKYLGIFKKIEDAIECRKAANIKYGFYKNHGKSDKAIGI